MGRSLTAWPKFQIGEKYRPTQELSTIGTPFLLGVRRFLVHNALFPALTFHLDLSCLSAWTTRLWSCPARTLQTELPLELPAIVRNLLLTPLRLAVGWGISPRILGMIGVTMLVLLRLTIGWHFLTEGSEKHRKGNWDASPFFANAKGPLADEFKKMVWDYDGTMRLNESRYWLEQYRNGAADYYTFGETELQAANEALDKLMENHALILSDYEDDLREYKLGRERIEELKQQKDRTGVESLAGQIATIQRENDAKLKPALAEIDRLWSGYEGTINSLASETVRAEWPPFEFVKPRSARIDTSVISRYLPYFDLAVGWCLLLGLFTPIAALAAAVFLGSVFLSQYPPGTGPTSSNYQLIECMACLVLAGTGAGRFAGLDYFIHLFIRRSEAKHALANR